VSSDDQKRISAEGRVDIGDADNTTATGVSIGTVDRSVEAPVTTHADVSGSAVLGSNSGNVANTNATGGAGGSASVTVNIERMLEDPPQTARQYLQSLWLLMLADQLERRERQEQTDARQAASDASRQALLAQQIAQHRWLIGLTIAVAISLLLNAGWIWQWQMRFGWFW
jgi:hypothetical protein